MFAEFQIICFQLSAMASSWQPWQPWQQWQQHRQHHWQWQQPAQPAQPASQTSHDFPAGQFVAARWPVTKAAHPDKGEVGSWQEMEEICKDMGCVVKLGGRMAKKRQTRHRARLTLKGPNAED